jgi:hypothetical protein
MRRFTTFDESQIAAAGWLLWITVFLGALALALVLTTAAAGGTTYDSFVGEFGNSSSQQRILLDVPSISTRATVHSWRPP